jgi:hypothetical protein
MDAFESIVAAIFEAQNYWVRRNVRLELPLESRRTRNSPRVEIDMIVLSQTKAELLVVECKSFLDSKGVRANAFLRPTPRSEKRYRLFLDSQYWSTVRNGVVNQLDLQGHQLRIQRCLVAGNVVGPSEPLMELASQSDWVFRDREWVRSGLKDLQKGLYTNDAVVMALKLMKT